MIKCLSEIKKNYVIIVYVDAVLDYIDPRKEIFSHRLYRENYVKTKMDNDVIYIKDLRIFKNIEENGHYRQFSLSFAFHLDNGIPILPFYDNKEDNELVTI